MPPMRTLGTLLYNNMILGGFVCFIFNNLKCIMKGYQLMFWSKNTLEVGLFCFVPMLEHWTDISIA